uniref:Head-to-tail adaptor n=1 Tax=Streptomyces sp. NBC_00003 TaxID=2903608 RepID=A0AAU2V8R2_9ACTN
MAAAEITVAEVCAVIGIAVPDPGTADGVWLAQAVAAINALAVDTVPRLRARPPSPGTSSSAPVRQADDVQDWPEDIRAALLMQAQRLFARRSSPTGVAVYGDAGPAYVAKWDPDVERLLRIGSWSPPQVG